MSSSSWATCRTDLAQGHRTSRRIEALNHENLADSEPLTAMLAFDETLAACIRDALARMKNIEEKKMFGGVGFLLNGNMLVGVWKDSLIVRLGLDAYADALLEPHIREFDITGKPMKVWVMVEPEVVEVDDRLEEWIQRAVKFVKTLPKN